MGVDLEVVFAARLTAEEAFALPSRLNHSLPVVAACRAYYVQQKPFLPGLELESWRWDEEFRSPLSSPADITTTWDSQYDSVRLIGPMSALWIERHRLHTMPGPKLTGFASDYQGCQAPIRRVCRAIARELGTDRVLYLPDSGEWAVRNLDALTFDEACAQLAAWGPPVPELGALGFGTAIRTGYHFRDGALRRADGTALTDDEILPGRNQVHIGQPDGSWLVYDRAGRLLSPEEAARTNLHGGFAYYIDDFRDLD